MAVTHCKEVVEQWFSLRVTTPVHRQVGGESALRVQNGLSRLWPLTAGVREPERKNLTFSFPGGLEECFLLRPPKKETPTRGVKTSSLPSPLGLFAVGRGGGATSKKMQLSN